MFAVLDRLYRLRSSVALVESPGKLEMFKTNVRESLRIRLEYENITRLLARFDGKTFAREILDSEGIDAADGEELIAFLNANHILIDANCSYLPMVFSEKHRIINLLEDYVVSSSEVIEAMEKLSTDTVLIVGLGAVGTWVATNLAQSGVANFILVDDDVVDISNLHRQDGFFEDDVGSKKIDVMKRRLQDIRDCKVETICDRLDESFFNRHSLDFSLAINCADYPSVDYTTELIGEYCMSKKIPHLIGGGYNLHLSLIGQSVLPGKSACVRCFRRALEKINQADLVGVKKLHRLHRKIGSFGPVCAVSASLTASEAFKILIGAHSRLTTLNRRVEFRIKSADFTYNEIAKNDDCEWCGSFGKYAS
jgi:molybdopterin/thiamine biosynthesis adenylyltransferase